MPVLQDDQESWQARFRFVHRIDVAPILAARSRVVLHASVAMAWMRPAPTAAARAANAGSTNALHPLVGASQPVKKPSCEPLWTCMTRLPSRSRWAVCTYRSMIAVMPRSDVTSQPCHRVRTSLPPDNMVRAGCASLALVWPWEEGASLPVGKASVPSRTLL
jgi:hypothetical protein